MKVMKLMAWKQGRNVNWFMEIMAVMKQIEFDRTDGILEFSGIVTTDWWKDTMHWNGKNGFNKTVGIGSANEIGIESAVLIWMVELRAWKLWKR